MAAKHTNGRLPLKLHTTVEEGVTNLEKKIFTVSVYARGLTGPVRVKFDQMLFLLPMQNIMEKKSLSK